MSHKISPYLLLVLFWGLCQSQAAGKDYWTYDTAYYAYDSGDFTLAADMYKRLAAKGDARAQNDLGFMYFVGQGVEQNAATAAKWFRKAARQGSVRAMLHLARMHMAGRGVPKSTVEAHKYFVLAEHFAKDDDQRLVAQTFRDTVSRALSNDQASRARHRLCVWWRTHGRRIGNLPQPLPRQLRHCEGP